MTIKGHVLPPLVRTEKDMYKGFRVHIKNLTIGGPCFFAPVFKKVVDGNISVCYINRARKGGLFFLHYFYSTNINENTLLDNNAEVKLMRTKITLECTECKQRNYNTTKDKKTHPDRVETKKYCKFCKKHTMHKETK